VGIFVLFALLRGPASEAPDHIHVDTARIEQRTQELLRGSSQSRWVSSHSLRGDGARRGGAPAAARAPGVDPARPAYGIGGLAAFWTIERVAAFWRWRRCIGSIGSCME